MDIKEIKEQLQYNVVKANALIQKTRYDLTAQEQKIVLRLIQMIEPNDDDIKTYEFNVQDLCDILGIDRNNSGNYDYIKREILNIRNKGFYLTLPDGREITASWINKGIYDPSNGNITIKLDDDLYPYLIDLKNFFTSYSLYYIIAMQGKYSIRLYEILKSYANLGKKEFELEEISRSLYCIYKNKKGQTKIKYPTWTDFRRYVIDPAVEEINELSDLNISYKTINKVKRVIGIVFIIKFKSNIDDRVETWKNIDAKLKSILTKE